MVVISIGTLELMSNVCMLIHEWPGSWLRLGGLLELGVMFACSFIRDQDVACWLMRCILRPSSNLVVFWVAINPTWVFFCALQVVDSPLIGFSCMHLGEFQWGRPCGDYRIRELGESECETLIQLQWAPCESFYNIFYTKCMDCNEVYTIALHSINSTCNYDASIWSSFIQSYFMVSIVI